MSYLDYGLEIISKIKSLGYEAYIVGGAVRDFLLKFPLNDIDITTNMPLEEVKNHFETKDNGIDYLSITIIYNGYDFEITHYRCDVSYSNHRHPEVKYVHSLFEDTLRRDFTVNALAMDEAKNIVDYHEGLKDLELKRIKMIGDPDVRFDEDALRILRALYFSSKLNFEIESETLISMIKNKKLLTFLSDERIMDYLKRIVYKDSTLGINYINEYDLFEYIPEYKKYLKVINRNSNENLLVYYYYINYKEYPSLITKEEKRVISSMNELISNSFSLLSLYKNQDAYLSLRDVFKDNGYDVSKIDNDLNGLIIKNDSELKITKKEISSMFKNEEIKQKIDEVIEKVLTKEIKNEYEDIINYLRG